MLNKDHKSQCLSVTSYQLKSSDHRAMHTPNIPLVYLAPESRWVFGYWSTESLESAWILSSFCAHGTVRRQELKVKQRAEPGLEWTGLAPGHTVSI